MKTFRMRLAGGCLMLLLLLGLLQPSPGHAQTPAAKPPSAAAPPALAPAQARAALDVLKDDAARARLIAVLEAIARTQGTGAVAPTAAAAPEGDKAALDKAAADKAAADKAAADKAKPPAIVLAPDSVGAQLLFGVSERIAGLSDEVVQVTRTVTDFPLLWNWLRRLATDRTTQLAILDALWRLVVVFGLGLAAEWIVRRLLRGPLQTLRDRAPLPHGHVDPTVQGIADAEEGQTEWTRRRANLVSLICRVPFVGAAFALDLLPGVAVIATGYALLASGMAGGLTSRLVILAVLNAFVVWRVVVSVARALASPDCERLRLIPVNDASAYVFVREVAVLAAVTVAGYAIAEAALLFGLYLIAHDALLKLNALLVYVLVVRIVLRNRRGMKNALRAPEGSHGLFSAGRNVLAGAWHRIVIFYLGALWLVWALEIQDGFARLLRVMLATVIVSVGARLVALAGEASLQRVMRRSDDIDERYPGMSSRLTGYAPLVRAGVNTVVTIVAIGVLFQAWGFDVASWFQPTGLGARVVSACGTIVITLVLALLVWEVVNAAIARHLAELARNSQLARSARLRTLLPMFRTTLLVTVCLIAGLVVLSEIGVNIAPLLAGAGVVGLAIGFGSQKLVQDIITGLFLLLENAMQVGDVVTLGGMSGTVEALSIRTIRLRAIDGAVHIVPFSAVTTVTNNTRDYGFAVLDVSVGLNEEPDRVADVLREVAAKLRTESPWRGMVLADLEVMGVEKFIDTAWVMRIRLKTLPANRWAVGRELNRRIKYRFDDLAIESPMTSYRVLSMAPAPETADSPVLEAQASPASVAKPA